MLEDLFSTVAFGGAYERAVRAAREHDKRMKRTDRDGEERQQPRGSIAARLAKLVRGALLPFGLRGRAGSPE